MKTHPVRSITATLVASLAWSALPACAAPRTQGFSDSTKPGALHVRTLGGDLTITGDDSRVVTVQAGDEDDASSDERADGLRRLDGGPSVQISEADNVVTIDMLGEDSGKAGRNTDLVINVPRDTRVSIERIGHGDTTIRDLRGDLEVRTIGDVEIAGASGAAVVESMRGQITATFAQLPASKPVSFTTVRGDIVVHVPADAKASVRFRTHQGEILTDFGEERLASTYSEEGGGAGSWTHVSVLADHRAAVQLEAMARSTESMTRQAEVIEREREQIEREAEEQARRGRDVQREAERLAESAARRATPPLPPVPPNAPKPPGDVLKAKLKSARVSVPTISGGKLVTGSLNGGGPELQITTLSGSITLRKVE